MLRSGLSDRLYADAIRAGSRVYYDEGDPVRAAVRTVEPKSLAVDLGEFQSWLRGLNATEEQFPTARLILEAATAVMENELGRAFVTQTVRDTFRLPAVYVVLTRSPFQELAATNPIIRLVEGIPTTLSTSDFYVEPGEPAVVRAARGVLGSTSDAFVTVEYKAGYGDTGADVPAPIRTALLTWASEIFETRGRTWKGESVAELPDRIGEMVDRYRVRRVL